MEKISYVSDGDFTQGNISCIIIIVILFHKVLYFRKLSATPFRCKKKETTKKNEYGLDDIEYGIV